MEVFLLPTHIENREPLTQIPCFSDVLISIIAYGKTPTGRISHDLLVTTFIQQKLAL